MSKKQKTTKETQKTIKKSQQTYKILIVDSEIGTRHLLTNYFNTNEENLSAVAVGSVSEAVKHLWTHREDLDVDIMVISSYLSGRTSGIDLVEIIRQLGFTDLPIFLLCRHDIDPEWERALFSGVRGFFNKTSITPDDIIKKLKRYIREVIEYEPKISEEIEREVVKTSQDQNKEYTYDFLRWKSPRGKLRGVSLGPSETNQIEIAGETEEE